MDGETNNSAATSRSQSETKSKSIILKTPEPQDVNVVSLKSRKEVEFRAKRLANVPSFYKEEAPLQSSISTKREKGDGQRKTVTIKATLSQQEEVGAKMTSMFMQDVSHKKNYKDSVDQQSLAAGSSFDMEEAGAMVLWEGTSPENGGLGDVTEFLINRRAPLSPFRTKQFRSNINRNRSKLKGPDPALSKIRIFGKLVVCISTTALIFWNFLYQHVINYTTFKGNCVSKVLYPENRKLQPFIVDLGYGACEYNTGMSAKDRCPVGSCASFPGHPRNLVRNYYLTNLTAAWDQFNPAAFVTMGALSTNLIRNYGEVYRLFWAMYLHAGWLHIGLNVICQIQLFWMLEPDWGFTRSALLFFISGVTGNLLSSVCNPCSLTVGSSGAMYGLLGALLPYSIEYWKSIPRPGCVLGLMVITIFVGILAGFSGITDNYAHMGGCLAGILFGFGTISNVSVFDKCTLGERILLSPVCSWALTDKAKLALETAKIKRKQGGENKRLLVLARRKTAVGKSSKLIYFIKRVFEKEGRPKCKVARREWIVRFSCWLSLILIWVLLLLYLLNPSLYKLNPPPGQLKFSGWVPCHCCKIYDTGLSGEDLLRYDSGLGAGRTYGVQGKYWCWTDKAVASAFCNKNIA